MSIAVNSHCHSDKADKCRELQKALGFKSHMDWFAFILCLLYVSECFPLHVSLYMQCLRVSHFLELDLEMVVELNSGPL